MKVLMVCLGNICRSPLAEGILKAKAKEHGLNWIIESRGTGGWHVGELPDKRSIEKAAEYKIDITDQRSELLVQADLKEFDHIYVMDSSNFIDVKKMCRTDEEAAKIRLILNEVDPPRNRPVPDPYWNNDGFEEVYQLLDNACDKIIERLS